MKSHEPIPQPTLHEAAASIEEHQSALPNTQAKPMQEQAIPIELKWRLPAWMLRDPGKRVRTPDDVIDFQEKGKRS